jgi:UDP-glucose 6-dehydrogenase
VKKVKSKIKPVDNLPPEELPTDVKQLREELRKAKLHNKLLNAIIDIAEEQLKIDIRKKSGTKQ